MTQETKDNNKKYFLICAAAIVGSLGGNFGDDIFNSGSNDKVMQTQIEYMSEGFKEFRGEVREYLKELATKADIERLEGKIKVNQDQIRELREK